jgi:uncharacterized protein (DUF58 family)
MTFSRAALHRAVGIRGDTARGGRTNGTPSNAERAAAAGVYASTADLVALEHAARGFSFLHRQPAHSLLAGRHGSRVRGRGLSFEELRQYLPGDDVRAIDWRVTARTAKPVVRVYSEEKDRPVLLVVDQRLNMFFGSRRAMKSVAAAETAALAAWRALAQGDRVGGLVFNDERIDEQRPQRSRTAVIRFLEKLAAQNAALRADSPVQPAPSQLDAALAAAARLAVHDHLVVVVSDFAGHGPATRQLLLRIAARNDVLAVLVHDPFLTALPSGGDLVVSDGVLQVELALGAQRTRRNIADFAHGYGREILAWEREIGVPVLPLSAAEETAPQIRRLLGQRTAQQRRH